MSAETETGTDTVTEDATDTPTDAAPETAAETADTAVDTADEATGEETSVDAPAGVNDRISRLEQEGDIAADYLEELLDIADLDGDLDIDVEADRAAVSIVGADLTQLVGRDGKVLEALQELTRLAVYRETGERSRLMLDVSGYRADKRTRLTQLGTETAAEVAKSGEPVSLEPMSPFERKIVHDAVAAAGLRSESAGVEPRRYVVVLPA
ncbi:protein jag [Nocardioides sp. BYT-33-1]|uniref:Jag family protein n=1 Tax=Nocardioides sp. BYT-33-1 TaxID=3416952 RepID=UPI003F52B1ED